MKSIPLPGDESVKLTNDAFEKLTVFWGLSYPTWPLYMNVDTPTAYACAFKPYENLIRGVKKKLQELQKNRRHFHLWKYFYLVVFKDVEKQVIMALRTLEKHFWDLKKINSVLSHFFSFFFF